MAVPFRITKLEDVAEGLRALYVKNADGTFTLEVDGAVDKSKLDEFRNRNIELMKEAEKFKDLNPEKYAELMELQRQREEKQLLDAGEIDKVVANRVETMKSEMQKTIDQLTGTNTSMTRQLETLMIDNTVRAAATKSGVRPEAVDDVLLRAKTMFKIHEGKVVSLDEKGQVRYGKDGQTPLGIEEWSGGLKAQAPHLFLGSQGGGAAGGTGGGGGSSGNPNARGVSKIAAALGEGALD